MAYFTEVQSGQTLNMIDENFLDEIARKLAQKSFWTHGKGVARLVHFEREGLQQGEDGSMVPEKKPCSKSEQCT
jgi:predicted transcriptional regulator